MKNKLFFSFVAAASFTASVQAQTILVDFGAVAPLTGSGYNQVVASDSAAVALTDSTGAASGVSISVTTTAGGTAANNNTVFVADTSGSGGSTLFEVYDDGIINAGTGADDIVLTFTGLDASATYDLFAGGQTLAEDFGATWTLVGLTTTVITTADQSTDPFASFAGFAADASGQITLTIEDISDDASPAAGRNVGISELTLTAAVPEPSSTALLGLGGLALLARRKRA